MKYTSRISTPYYETRALANLLQTLSNLYNYKFTIFTHPFTSVLREFFGTSPALAIFLQFLQLNRINSQAKNTHSGYVSHFHRLPSHYPPPFSRSPEPRLMQISQETSSNDPLSTFGVEPSRHGRIPASVDDLEHLFSGSRISHRVRVC